MTYIETAYRGRVKMLQAIFGGSSNETVAAAPVAESTRPLTPALFDALFGGVR